MFFFRFGVTVFTVKFWKDAGERAVKTAAQAAVAVVGTGVSGILEVDFVQLASVSALAGLVSVLTSVASSRVGDPESASVVGGE